jgi:DNA-binding transcriptional ArsR family regulator
MGDKAPMSITAQQYRLLASPIRLRILHVLADESKTAKQVADAMGETRGNVHYHIQRLVEGGLVELVETRQAGSITEKYYRARGTRLVTPGDPEEPKAGRFAMVTWLALSQAEADDLLQQVGAVLTAWEKRPPTDEAVRHDYQVAFRIVPATDATHGAP